MSISKESLKDIKYPIFDFDFIIEIRAPNESFAKYIERLKANGNLNSVLNYTLKPAISGCKNFNNSNTTPYNASTIQDAILHSEYKMYKEELKPDISSFNKFCMQNLNNNELSSTNVNTKSELQKDALNQLIQFKNEKCNDKAFEEKFGAQLFNSVSKSENGYNEQSVTNKLSNSIDEMASNFIYDKNGDQRSTDDVISELLNQRRNAIFNKHSDINIGTSMAKNSNIPVSSFLNSSQADSLTAQKTSASAVSTSMYENSPFPLQFTMNLNATQSSQVIHNQVQNSQIFPCQQMTQGMNLPPTQQIIPSQFSYNRGYTNIMPNSDIQKLYINQMQQINENTANNGLNFVQSIDTPSQHKMYDSSMHGNSNTGLRQASNLGIIQQGAINNLQMNLQNFNMAHNQPQMNWARSQHQISMNNSQPHFNMTVSQQENVFSSKQNINGFQELASNQSQIGSQYRQQSCEASKIIPQNNTSILSGTIMLAKYPYERNFNSPFGVDGELSLKVMDELIFIEHHPEANGWSLVKYKDGKQGYVPFNYLTMKPISTGLPWLQNKSDEIHMPLIQSKVIKPYISAYDKSREAINYTSEYKCEICNKTFNGPQPFNSHMESKAHKTEVEIQESYKKL